MALIVLLSLVCLLGAGLVAWASWSDQPDPEPYRPRHAAGGAP